MKTQSKGAGASYLLSGIHTALPAVSLFAYLLLSEPVAVLLLFLSALVAHEWGHLLAFALLGIPLPRFSILGVGTRLSPAFPLLPREELFTALAGPLCNLLFAFFALRFGVGDFFLLFAAVHLLFALGNLLPFGKSDGERILSLTLYRVCPRYAHILLRFFSAFFLSFFFFFSLFLFYLTGNGLCGVIFSLFFLLSSPNGYSNDF